MSRAELLAIVQDAAVDWGQYSATAEWDGGGIGINAEQYTDTIDGLHRTRSVDVRIDENTVEEWLAGEQDEAGIRSLVAVALEDEAYKVKR